MMMAAKSLPFGLPWLASIGFALDVYHLYIILFRSACSTLAVVAYSFSVVCGFLK